VSAISESRRHWAASLETRRHRQAHQVHPTDHGWYRRL